MTPKQFRFALEGFNEYEEEKRDREDFNIRRLCFHTIVVHLDKDKSNIKQESDLWPHKWDEEIEKKRRNSLPIARVIYE